MKPTLEDFHKACRTVRTHCPDGYAKAYANAGVSLSDSEAVRVQCLYILSNMTRWRGDQAKACRETFKALSVR